VGQEEEEEAEEVKEEAEEVEEEARLEQESQESKAFLLFFLVKGTGLPLLI